MFPGFSRMPNRGTSRLSPGFRERREVPSDQGKTGRAWKSKTAGFSTPRNCPQSGNFATLEMTTLDEVHYDMLRSVLLA